MCIAFPGTVTSIKDRVATVEYNPPTQNSANPSEDLSFTKQVMIGDKQTKIGDKVMVQMGIIVKVISQEENDSILEAWSSLQ